MATKTPPLIPIVRLAESPIEPSRRRVFPVAATVILMIVLLGGYAVRPDDRYLRAKNIVDAYEHGIGPNERDYSSMVYADAIRELESVRITSTSRIEATRLAERLRSDIARHHQQQALAALGAH